MIVSERAIDRSINQPVKNGGGGGKEATRALSFLMRLSTGALLRTMSWLWTPRPHSLVSG